MSALTTSIELGRRIETRELSSRLSSVRGLTMTAEPMHLPIGSQVRIEPAAHRSDPVLGEVIASDREKMTIMIYEASSSAAPGDRVVALQSLKTIGVSPHMIGRVFDGLGRPLDSEEPPIDTIARPIDPEPVKALQREPIRVPLETGVRAIDGMITVGRGQRLGIFSGPGVGKSTVLGMLARNTQADVTVIAMVGERGREVREFLEHTLGAEGLARSVVFVATSDESPLMRVRAAKAACATAEFFRDQGLDVVLLMDSVTRFCQAQRQIGLTAGEPPTTRGYPPSVFSSLPQLLERAGSVRQGGSITGFYAVLVEGDDMTEPVSDAVRGILDGHLVLSRRLANLGHYPAIDVLDSVSRSANSICQPNHTQASRLLARLLARHSEIEEVLSVGAFVRGANRENDVAVDFKPRLDAFLRQSVNEVTQFDSCVQQMTRIAVDAGQALATANSPQQSPAS